MKKSVFQGLKNFFFFFFFFMQTITMHMVSYAGRAEMQILVAKDIIPDPEFLAECLENALLEMKTAATTFETK